MCARPGAACRRFWRFPGKPTATTFYKAARNIVGLLPDEPKLQAAWNDAWRRFLYERPARRRSARQSTRARGRLGAVGRTPSSGVPRGTADQDFKGQVFDVRRSDQRGAHGHRARSGGVRAGRHDSSAEGVHQHGGRHRKHPGLLDGSLRGQQPSVQNLRGRWRVYLARLLEGTVRRKRPHAVVGGRHAAVPRQEWPSGPGDLGAGVVPSRTGGLPGGRRQLVRGRRVRGVRRQGVTDRVSVAPRGRFFRPERGVRPHPAIQQLRR